VLLFCVSVLSLSWQSIVSHQENSTKQEALVEPFFLSCRSSVFFPQGGLASCVDGSGNADEPGFAPPVVKHVSKEGKLSIGPFGVCVVTAMQQYLLRSILVQQPVRFKLGGRPVLSAHLNVETAGSEPKRPEF
jgi:hypothetical protein